MLTPYHVGLAAGNAVTGAAVGVVQGLGEALDFASLLSRPGSESSGGEVSEPSFEAINAGHQQLARQRVEIAETQGEFEAFLQSLGIPAGANVQISRDGIGNWQVSGAAELRGAIEAALEQSSEADELWNRLASQLQDLVSSARSVDDLTGVQLSGRGLPASSDWSPEDIRLEFGSGRSQLSID